MLVLFEQTIFSSPKARNKTSTAEKMKIRNVKDNQNGKAEYDFNWADTKIERLLELFKLPRFLVLFLVVHTLQNIFRNCIVGTPSPFTKERGVGHESWIQRDGRRFLPRKGRCQKRGYP